VHESVNHPSTEPAAISAEPDRADALDQALAHIAELEALLEDLPGIFERKFEQRLQPVLERQQRLLEENQQLHQEVLQLQPAPGEVRLRFNPESHAPAKPELLLPPVPRRAPLRFAALRRQDDAAA
jgi:hypothetical protein